MSMSLVASRVTVICPNSLESRDAAVASLEKPSCLVVRLNFKLRRLKGGSMSNLPATLHILRGSLKSYPSNGHAAFVPQIRKLVIEYCDFWPSSQATRTFLQNHVEELAHKNPHVEIVVRQRPFKQPIARGFYCMSGKQGRGDLP